MATVSRHEAPVPGAKLRNARAGARFGRGGRRPESRPFPRAGVTRPGVCAPARTGVPDGRRRLPRLSRGALGLSFPLVPETWRFSATLRAPVRFGSALPPARTQLPRAASHPVLWRHREEAFLTDTLQTDLFRLRLRLPHAELSVPTSRVRRRRRVFLGASARPTSGASPPQQRLPRKPPEDPTPPTRTSTPTMHSD